jgi:CRISPR-associated endoribonuclease Cas6
MLVSLVLEVTPPAECRLPLTVGAFAHALFLSLVKADAPELSAALHEDFDYKPFTVSPLLGKSERVGDLRVFRPGETYWMRFTSLIAPLSRLLVQWETREWPPLRLMGAEFQVVRSTADPLLHPWAGRSDYDDLWRKHLIEPEPPGPVVTLDFFTPTTFKSGGLNVPLPLPRFLIYGWRNKWDRYGPAQLGDETGAELEKSVALAAYEAKSVIAEFGQSRAVGFTGWARLKAVKADDEWVRAFRLLAEYAFYAGTGQLSTMGFGMTRMRGK